MQAVLVARVPIEQHARRLLAQHVRHDRTKLLAVPLHALDLPVRDAHTGCSQTCPSRLRLTTMATSHTSRCSSNAHECTKPNLGSSSCAMVLVSSTQTLSVYQGFSHTTTIMPGATV